MRALIRTGDPKTLSLSTIPEPQPSAFPNHYIIRTRATALCRGELAWTEPLLPETPIPGYDVAGIVISAPETSLTLQAGDEVYGLTSFERQGNAREITIATEEEACLKPKNLSWEEAASVPLSSLTAYQALFDHGKLLPPVSAQATEPSVTSNEKKRVLVTAASGGVGIWAVQLAHHSGAEVVATCGPSNVMVVTELGADTVLDHSKTNVLSWVSEDREARGFDLVLDCIGGKTLEDAWKCARAGGRVISVAEPPDSKKPYDGVADGVVSSWFVVKANRDQLKAITGMIEKNLCRGIVDSTFAIEQWERAFERLEGGHAKGKVILTFA